MVGMKFPRTFSVFSGSKRSLTIFITLAFNRKGGLNSLSTMPTQSPSSTPSCSMPRAFRSLTVVLVG